MSTEGDLQLATNKVLVMIEALSKIGLIYESYEEVTGYDFIL
jgi:hypothetical protein